MKMKIIRMSRITIKYEIIKYRIVTGFFCCLKVVGEACLIVEKGTDVLY